MKLIAMIAVTLISAVSASAQNRDPKALVAFAMQTCASGNGAPASTETLRQRLGDDFTDFSMFCMLYNDAWKKGFDLGLAEGKEAEYFAYCRGVVSRIAGGDTTYSFQNDLQARYPDVAERAVVATTCSTYKSAYQDGLKYARDAVRR